MRHVLAGILLLSLALTASACQLFSPIADPSSVGCTKAEESECRVVAAALIVKAANVTIGQEMDRGTITPAEALRLRSITRRAEDALAEVRKYLPLEDATFDQRLEALEGVLLELLTEQILSPGV